MKHISVWQLLKDLLKNCEEDIIVLKACRSRVPQVALFVWRYPQETRRRYKTMKICIDLFFNSRNRQLNTFWLTKGQS